MKRKLAQIILLIVVLAITAYLVVQNGITDANIYLENGSPPGIESQQNIRSAGYQEAPDARATATYGAEQFSLQLTAIAGEK